MSPKLSVKHKFGFNPCFGGSQSQPRADTVKVCPPPSDMMLYFRLALVHLINKNLSYLSDYKYYGLEFLPLTWFTAENKAMMYPAC